MGTIKRIIADSHQVAKRVSGQIKRPYLFVLLDIVFCGCVYGASPNNYEKFDFYLIKHNKRKTYVTNRISNKLIKKYNQNAYRPIFEEKDKFAEKFADVFKREWLVFPGCTEAEYEQFVKNKTRFICKPMGGAQGVGIQVFHNNIPTFEELSEHLVGKYIIEEYITQHEKLDAYFADALNCIRIITVLKNGKVTPVVANITYSIGHQIANASFGGVTAEIDVQTGEVTTDGGVYGHQLFEKHPCTGMTFKGFMIPYWDEVLAMIDNMGKRVPQVGYIGWDIAISKDGPVVIEGNTSPGYTYFQIPQLLESRIGTLDKYRDFL